MLAMTRIGDLEAIHCSVPARASGNPNVIITGSAASVVCDINIPHKKPAGPSCVIHSFAMLTGAPKVFIGSRSAGTVGSITCTFAVQGSPNVFCAGSAMSYENAEFFQDAPVT